MSEFDKQVIQIASLGVWQIVTGKTMSKQLKQVLDPRWEHKTGLFITLKKSGNIRGSMGLLDSNTTLAETLFEVAGTAATHDSRHPPIEENEIKDLEINVTLLSEIKKLKSADDIKIKQTGLIISRGANRAVLLPHVASDNNWSSEQFLEACCEKAKLSHKAWRDPNTLVEYFTGIELNGGPLLNAIEEFIS
ncbi:MAG: AmmeMemoRadiSam system protein A [Oligoflexia bacterium]|nr:AmmeMemoRadiSam system protein A [Oligoflexia bacterium]